ncbi:MAG: Rrf2 family transcriptional regulator [FCB group bacterium]|nr:Rrf2 family transcriptional regulator [FCB group bacterium]
MIFSPTAQYAMRAMIYLARQSNGKPVRVVQIAQAEGIPKQFLSKILHILRQKGLVKAVRGPGGGFLLADRYERITINRIVKAIDSDYSLEDKCILGLPECLNTNSCVLHRPWKKIRKLFEITIGNKTLKQIMVSVDGEKNK